ncbi:MAG TPA: hypothetical protein VL728_03050 [Cyclobacteriaceae bacterium]|nr:hypothetical protein [Cyclobacteriaceae bacterium]
MRAQTTHKASLTRYLWMVNLFTLYTFFYFTEGGVGIGFGVLLVSIRTFLRTTPTKAIITAWPRILHEICQSATTNRNLTY